MTSKSVVVILFASSLSLSLNTGTGEMLHTTASTPTFHFTLRGSGNLSEAQKTIPDDNDKLKQSDWYTAILKNIEQSEYRFTKADSSGNYSTPNRKNNLRFYYDENGFSVEPRSTKIPVGNFDPVENPDQIKFLPSRLSKASEEQGRQASKNIPNWKVSFLLDKKQVGKGEWLIDGNKAAYKTDNITVQYINNDEGMRQNFIVQKPLSESNKLTLNFSVHTTLAKKFSSDRLQFVHPKSGAVLNYDGLKVWDANGNILDAVFEKNGKDYCINVNTINATYPITIDPISTTPAIMIESNQNFASMGTSVSSAGDVNGDGYSDIIVGAYLYDNGETDEGAAFIYHGSATGISTTSVVMLESNQANANFGRAVAGAGDINADGYCDVVVGASGYDNGEADEGAAFIYYGSSTVMSTATILESNQAVARLGWSVASAGDVNGDGFSDVVVGAILYNFGQNDEGAAFIYHGSTGGISTTPAAMVQSNQVDAFMGRSVASAGDVNGDGYSDIIVGAELYNNIQNDEGAAFIYHGSAAGISTTAAAMVESDQPGAQLGYSVASAGDVNGDGYSDVIVGAELYDNGQANEGAAFIYHGSPSGINTIAAAMMEGNLDNADFGRSVACAGDINGDGYSDVIVGADLYNNGQLTEGAAFIYHGSAAGIYITATAMLESNQVGGRLGSSVASAGDVNGDGYSDVIVGAELYDNGETNEGAAFIYHGSPSGINTIAAAMLESNQASAQMGVSVACAGDVNGDGYSDVIVGARFYSAEGAAFIYHGSATGINTTAAAMLLAGQNGAQFGGSVASAGDVNGDGYSDVVVGAERFDYSLPNNNEGISLIYHGSATGINTTYAAVLESNQNDVQFGRSVACAGDVNGDGYSDVIVGAYRYSNGQATEGAAFIYHGSASGVNTTAAAMLESNQAGAWLGWSVASAGDVNGDGYGDVIVGAQLYDGGLSNEGAALIYHGSASGVNTTVVAVLESNSFEGRHGYSVAGAGDVNGDGYSDVIVGANQYDNGSVQQDEGAAFIYHGSPSGINTVAVATIESNQGGARLGSSVASAGDVNGDGYSDVIVGANQYDNGLSNEGAAFIYHGSPTGINTTAATMVESDQLDAEMGISVASAGDVNGDGYSDVIVGTPQYDSGLSNEGAAFIYPGNNTINYKRNNLDMYNVDLTTPISSSNFSAAHFGAGLFAKSFLGRNKGKLVWETKRNYHPFSGNPITNSVAITSQQSSYTDLGQAGIELKNLVEKQPARYTKIRTRVKYNPATAITGQMYGPWRYVPEQITGLSMGVLPVDIISFTVDWLQQGKTAQINFTTDNETAICCYEIEKSSDGFNFIKIGQLTATNTSALYTYHFIDNNATRKKQYYRLKTIHLTGSVDYSDIRLLQHNTAIEIWVFPNPATDDLQLQLNKAYDKMKVQIVNSAGQTVRQFTAMPAANQTIKIPVSNLASGIYFLYLQSGEEKQVLQFVKK